MTIDDIKIFPCFSTHPPKLEKMERKEQYFRETGCLQSEIILDGAGNLIDGYTSYLLAKAHGLASVPDQVWPQADCKGFSPERRQGVRMGIAGASGGPCECRGKADCQDFQRA